MLIADLFVDRTRRRNWDRFRNHSPKARFVKLTFSLQVSGPCTNSVHLMIQGRYLHLISDFADEFPDVEVTGTDISPIQPVWVPPKVKL